MRERSYHFVADRLPDPERERRRLLAVTAPVQEDAVQEDAVQEDAPGRWGGFVADFEAQGELRSSPPGSA
jgi:hypothetical protein